MRELKFRVCDKEKNFYYFNIGQPLSDQQLILYHLFVIDGKEFNQYTGLKDKNGKEIYEGDIVKFIDYNQKNSMGVIYFGRTYQGFEVVTYNSHEFSGESYVLSDLQSSLSNEEIIGDIYNNPELLK